MKSEKKSVLENNFCTVADAKKAPRPSELLHAQTSIVAAAATTTSIPTTAATVPSAAGEAPANTAPPSSSPGGGAGQGTDSTSGGVSQPGFIFGAATEDELIAQQLTDVQAMDM